MIDLRPHFKHCDWRPMRHSFGVPVASDWTDKAADDPVFGIYKRCGLWTMDEAQILHECAKQAQKFGPHFLDIGCHTFWTTAHIAAAGGLHVVGVDPMLRVEEFRARCWENVASITAEDGVPIKSRITAIYEDFEHGTSDEYFGMVRHEVTFSGVCIDGDHDRPCPIRDAKNAAAHLESTGVILLHDAIGGPVQDAVMWLSQNGFKVKVYPTVHVVAVAWRGNFAPPVAQVDPRVAACVRPCLGEIARFV